MENSLFPFATISHVFFPCFRDESSNDKHATPSVTIFFRTSWTVLGMLMILLLFLQYGIFLPLGSVFPAVADTRESILNNDEPTYRQHIKRAR